MPPGFIPGSLLSDREIPDHHQIMLDALEAARQRVCAYRFQRTCDCKFGLIPYPLQGTQTANCTHRHCEHTGCPEIRQLMAQVKNAQRNAWARRSAEHARTSHGWLCCTHHPDYDSAATTGAPGASYDGTPEGATCGGVGFCLTCTPEADRLHGLLPPLVPESECSNCGAMTPLPHRSTFCKIDGITRNEEHWCCPGLCTPYTGVGGAVRDDATPA